jgi:hypothetical protein
MVCFGTLSPLCDSSCLLSECLVPAIYWSTYCETVICQISVDHGLLGIFKFIWSSNHLLKSVQLLKNVLLWFILCHFWLWVDRSYLWSAVCLVLGHPESSDQDQSSPRVALLGMGSGSHIWLRMHKMSSCGMSMVPNMDRLSCNEWNFRWNLNCDAVTFLKW